MNNLSPETFALAAAGLAALATCLLALGLAGALKARVQSGVTWLASRSDQSFVETLKLDLQFERLALYVGISAIVLGGGVFVLTNELAPALIAGSITPIFPVVYYYYALGKRREQIEQVLPAALQQLSSAMQSSASIVQAVERVGQTAPAPIDSELALLAEQAKALMSFKEALHLARRRIRTRNFDMVAVVLISAQSHGGDIATALENLASVFLEIGRLQKQVKTATEKGKRTMQIMSLTPVILVAVVAMVEPSFIKSVTDTFTGIVLLGISLCLYLTAITLAWRLMKIDI